MQPLPTDRIAEINKYKGQCSLHYCPYCRMPRAARAPRLTIEQRATIVRLYYENGKNANLTVSSFRRAYPAYRTLCRSTVFRLVAKFEEHGTMEDRLKGHCGRKKSIRVQNNINTLAQIVERDSMEVCGLWLPLRFKEGRTHFGSINSYNQAL